MPGVGNQGKTLTLIPGSTPSTSAEESKDTSTESIKASSGNVTPVSFAAGEASKLETTGQVDGAFEIPEDYVETNVPETPYNSPVEQDNKSHKTNDHNYLGEIRTLRNFVND